MIIICRDCHRQRPNRSAGRCATCHRHHHAPPTGNPGGAGIPKTAQDITGRVEDLFELLATRQPQRELAARLGVSCRTVQRYQAGLRNLARVLVHLAGADEERKAA